MIHTFDSEFFLHSWLLWLTVWHPKSDKSNTGADKRRSPCTKSLTHIPGPREYYIFYPYTSLDKVIFYTCNSICHVAKPRGNRVNSGDKVCTPNLINLTLGLSSTGLHARNL